VGKGKERIDRLLVARGLAETRSRAQALIEQGKVYVAGKLVDKASAQVATDLELQVAEHEAYVSRGGEKLAGALTDLGLSTQGLVVADIGASTGGFTDCVLRNGAERVYAIDVGHGQLHPALLRDARVVNIERTNARELRADSLPERVDLVVVDASFIGLGKLLPALVSLLKEGGRLLALVKPQFEVGPERVGKRGVVHDDELRQQALAQVIAAAAPLGLRALKSSDCKLPGPEGNREIFVLFAQQR
jgi:23S rRNA (cytidine1920-2'-O)/16S rRNA (cytidine1409-2'-O)-methyltransferase